MRAEDGCVALYPAGPDAVLTVLAGPRTDVGRLHLEARRTCTRLADLLAGKPPDPVAGTSW